MGEPDWSSRDLTGIKPRRPEGAAGEDVDDWEEEQTPLSFIWPQLGNSVIHSKHLQQQREHQWDVDNNNKKLPVKVDSTAVTVMTKTAAADRRRRSQPCNDDDEDDCQEFEFNMCTAASSSDRECPSGMSSADELFFKGKLLPLHLPPRLQMVQRLASEKQQQQQQQQLESITTTSQIVPPVVQQSEPQQQQQQPRVLLRPANFNPKFSKFWMMQQHNNTEHLLSSADAAAATAADAAGIARFRGQSWSDPRDQRDSSSSSTDSCSRDSTSSARDSSSSRDSNGSSQDAMFSDSSSSSSSKAAFQILPPLPISSDLKGSFLHNREVFGSTHVRSLEEQRSSTISSWLKPPFKWKVLFGAAAAAKKAAAAMRLSPSSRDPKAGHWQQQQQQQSSLSHVSEEEEEEEEEESSSLDTRTLDNAKSSDTTACDKSFCNDYSGELSSLQRVSYTEASSSSSASSSSFFSSRGLERASVVGCDIERNQRGMAKAREYLHKYMKMLKPLQVKKYEQYELEEESCCNSSHRRGGAGSLSLPSSSLAHETRRHSSSFRNIASNRSFSSYSQSSRFAAAAAATASTDVVSPCRSHSALGTPTTMRRGSGRPLSSGSIAELHSAIQGAIAHCKESQATAKYEHAHRSQRFGPSAAIR